MASSASPLQAGNLGQRTPPHPAGPSATCPCSGKLARLSPSPGSAPGLQVLLFLCSHSGRGRAAPRGDQGGGASTSPRPAHSRRSLIACCWARTRTPPLPTLARVPGAFPHRPSRGSSCGPGMQQALNTRSSPARTRSSRPPGMPLTCARLVPWSQRQRGRATTQAAGCQPTVGISVCGSQDSSRRVRCQGHSVQPPGWASGAGVSQRAGPPCRGHCPHPGRGARTRRPQGRPGAHPAWQGGPSELDPRRSGTLGGITAWVLGGALHSHQVPRLLHRHRRGRPGLSWDKAVPPRALRLRVPTPRGRRVNRTRGRFPQPG